MKKRLLAMFLSLVLVVGLLDVLGVDPLRSGFGGTKAAKADPFQKEKAEDRKEIYFQCKSLCGRQMDQDHKGVHKNDQGRIIVFIISSII
ncbi:MAG: hypothetical protein J5819_06445 [Eubacterium sp.]|nr:hypothetical protein [Eubacterium sp.]